MPQRDDVRFELLSENDERLRGEIRELDRKFNDLDKALAILQTKFAMVAVIAGSIGSLLGAYLVRYFSHP